MILTHQDIDHIGSLAAILKELPGQVKVLAHSAERDYIQGEKLPLKLAQLEAGARVIHTPGHTPGHISLYLGAQKTLIAGRG